MVFSSPIFLFLFLPLALVAGVCPGLKMRNRLLLVFSVIFYAWGEPGFVLLLLTSALINYGLGLWVDRETESLRRKWAVGVAVGFNIGLLVFFKYANFVVGNLNACLQMFHFWTIHLNPIRMPIGISFFTFHALSYVIDIYRRKWPAARDPADVALYIFFFPQLVAGPILRWSGIAPQLAYRAITRAGFAEGIRRFSGGLAKKVILANVMAGPVDKIFALPAPELTPPLAWLAVVCYSLQIYFDFSGYSDMAVGLGKMFGFEFLENFNFPYIAQSINEFWRRWHISLSTWFRDYLYIPLSGNRCSSQRNKLNLVIVFFLCGLWHGASWTFVIWGLYHGLFLVLERTRFVALLNALPRAFHHGYTLAVVAFGWVLFRAETFGQARSFFVSLAGFSTAANQGQPLARYWSHELAWSLAFGVLFAMPILPWLQVRAQVLQRSIPTAWAPVVVACGQGLQLLMVVALLLISVSLLAGTTYNPFIYFRF